MNSPVLLPVLLLCAVIALLLWRRKARPVAPGPWPFQAKKPLPSAQQVLYHRLASALPGCTVLAGVALDAVLEVKRGFDAAHWKRRIRHLQYDFVVCAQDATVLAAITLDDTGGADTPGRRADAIRVRASSAAGLRLIRWQRRALPDVAAIQAVFEDLPMPYLDDMASSANASWWPPIASASRQPPAKR